MGATVLGGIDRDSNIDNDIYSSSQSHKETLISSHTIHDTAAFLEKRGTKKTSYDLNQPPDSGHHNREVGLVRQNCMSIEEFHLSDFILRTGPCLLVQGLNDSQSST